MDMKPWQLEVARIQQGLRCGHCDGIFVGTFTQARRVKYEKSKKVYCSQACRKAAQQNLLTKLLPNRGPCPTCGKHFFSKTAKVFCNLTCYVRSAQFDQMLAASRAKSMAPESRAKNAAARRKGQEIACLECGTPVYRKRSDTRRFCNKPCYRSYLAKRFDRWMANPEGMALPQCYDEFLDREVLSCVVGHCEWRGRHLTLHVNQVHGLKAREFKRATGFNLSTGVICKPLAELLSDRQQVGVAAMDYEGPKPEPGEVGRVIAYQSIEGAEHRQKGFALALATPGPHRICKGCGVSFTQRTKLGRALYCSPACRDAHYRTDALTT